MEQQTVIKAKKMAELNQNQSTFAANRKEEALAKFESIPMPKEKDEEWRYTNIGKLKIEEFDLNQPKTNIS